MQSSANWAWVCQDFSNLSVRSSRFSMYASHLPCNVFFSVLSNFPGQSDGFCIFQSNSSTFPRFYWEEINWSSLKPSLTISHHCKWKMIHAQASQRRRRHVNMSPRENGEMKMPLHSRERKVTWSIQGLEGGNLSLVRDWEKWITLLSGWGWANIRSSWEQDIAYKGVTAVTYCTAMDWWKTVIVRWHHQDCRKHYHRRIYSLQSPCGVVLHFVDKKKAMI